MIGLLRTGVRTGLFAVAMAAAVPMLPYAPATAPAPQSAPAAAKSTVADASPTDGENGADDHASVPTGVSTQPALPAAVEVEIQRRFNELRSELLDDRADTIDWWLVAITIFLGFFALVAVVGGYMGFRRFREIETEAKNSVKTVKEYAEDAKGHVREIARNREESSRLVREMSAQTAADDPEKAGQAVANVRENPQASLMDKAIARALSLQQQGKRDEAIQKWRAVARVAEKSDNGLAARAWFSVGYLVQDENPQDGILAYNQAIRLQPDLAKAYYNRGIAKGALKQYKDAIADYNEAIRLQPDDAEAYSNRGAAKAALEQYQEAIADYDQAILLKPDLAGAYSNRGSAKDELGRYQEAIADYDQAIRLQPDDAEAYSNRGNAKDELGRKDEARQDLETALALARNANNAEMVALVEQLLHKLDATEDA